MKIEVKKVTRLLLKQMTSLDDISVILEDLGPGQGKITVECFGLAWSKHWTTMGEMSVSQFIAQSNAAYIACKLQPQPIPAMRFQYLCRLVRAIQQGIEMVQESENEKPLKVCADG